MVVSPRVIRLVEEYQLWQKESLVREGENVISVDEVLSRVASFYEKIRGIVDWRDEHLLRKTAIERILKRRIFVNGFSEDFAEAFLSELVRGGHFPNNRISFEKVAEIQDIIARHVGIMRRYRQNGGKTQKEPIDWLFSVTAVEIEEALSNPRRERALMELMAEEVLEKIEIVPRKNVVFVLTPQEQMLQVYVAVQRALLKLDAATISYHILEKFYPDWKIPDDETLASMGENLDILHENIQGILKNPYAEKFYRVAERYDTPYLILGDIVSEEMDGLVQLVENPLALEEKIHYAYNRRLARLKGRIGRAALYSTVSVFLTKILFAVALEIPFERYVTSEELNYVALGLNMAFPPLLMLGLVVTAQTTSARNFEKVTLEVMKIIQEHERQDLYKILPPRKRKGLMAGMIYTLYFFSFLFSFGVVLWLLRELGFSLFSIAVFLMFISLVLFAGTRIRQRAQELMIEAPHEGFLNNIFDFFSLPMIQAGRWLSGKFVRYNIFVLILNFLIEVPFQMFVEFLEQWRGFLREKKEEIH